MIGEGRDGENLRVELLLSFSCMIFYDSSTWWNYRFNLVRISKFPSLPLVGHPPPRPVSIVTAVFQSVYITQKLEFIRLNYSLCKNKRKNGHLMSSVDHIYVNFILRSIFLSWILFIADCLTVSFFTTECSIPDQGLPNSLHPHLSRSHMLGPSPFLRWTRMDSPTKIWTRDLDKTRQLPCP